MENFNVYDMQVGDSYKEGVKGIIGYTEDPHFKLLKVNFKNSFTKSDLISGEHVVEFNNGARCLVAGEYLIDSTGYMPLSDYDEYLQYKNENYTINKVFDGKVGDKRICASRGLFEYLCDKDLKLIYDRQENEHRASQEARLCALEESIAEQEKEAEKLREELKL